jgi:hypothetical protein
MVVLPADVALEGTALAAALGASTAGRTATARGAAAGGFADSSHACSDFSSARFPPVIPELTFERDDRLTCVFVLLFPVVIRSDAAGVVDADIVSVLVAADGGVVLLVFRDDVCPTAP